MIVTDCSETVDFLTKNIEITDVSNSTSGKLTAETMRNCFSKQVLFRLKQMALFYFKLLLIYAIQHLVPRRNKCDSKQVRKQKSVDNSNFSHWVVHRGAFRGFKTRQ